MHFKILVLAVGLLTALVAPALPQCRTGFFYQTLPLIAG